jgi:hypothetical protein
MGKYVKKASRVPYGPLAKHGGYSTARKDELIRRNPEVQRYLKVVRHGLVRDLCPEGEEHLTMARRVVLDRLMQKLATARLVETYLAEHGILRPDKLAERTLEAHSVTTLWLALNNQIREDLKLLGLDRKVLEAIVLTPEELAAVVEAEDAAESEKTEAARGCGMAGATEPAKIDGGKDDDGDKPQE